MSKIEREWDSISSWQASQSVLISKKSPKHTQSCQIWSNTKISNNPAKYEVLLNRTWVQSWTLISETAVRRFRINHKILCNKTDIWQSVLNVQHRRWSIYGLCTAKKMPSRESTGSFSHSYFICSLFSLTGTNNFENRALHWIKMNHDILLCTCFIILS